MITTNISMKVVRTSNDKIKGVESITNGSVVLQKKYLYHIDIKIKWYYDFSHYTFKNIKLCESNFSVGMISKSTRVLLCSTLLLLLLHIIFTKLIDVEH